VEWKNPKVRPLQLFGSLFWRQTWRVSSFWKKEWKQFADYLIKKSKWKFSIFNEVRDPIWSDIPEIFRSNDIARIEILIKNQRNSSKWKEKQMFGKKIVVRKIQQNNKRKQKNTSLKYKDPPRYNWLQEDDSIQKEWHECNFTVPYVQDIQTPFFQQISSKFQSGYLNAKVSSIPTGQTGFRVTMIPKEIKNQGSSSKISSVVLLVLSLFIKIQGSSKIQLITGRW
jgi:hypothetical protein